MKLFRMALLGIGALLVVLPGLIRAREDKGGDLRAAIEAVNKQWEEAVRKGDAHAAAALYTEDAQVLPPNSDAIKGRSAIEKFYKAAIEELKGTTLETVEVYGNGSVAYEVGRYQTRGADGKVADEGKYVVIWKHVGNEWQLHRDMWSSNRPAK